MKTVLSVSASTDVPEALETIRAITVIGGLRVWPRDEVISVFV